MVSNYFPDFFFFFFPGEKIEKGKTLKPCHIPSPRQEKGNKYTTMLLLACTFHSLDGRKQTKTVFQLSAWSKNTLDGWARRYEGRKNLEGKHFLDHICGTTERKLVPKTHWHCKLPWISLNLLSFLGTCVLLYRSRLWGKRPLNTVLVFKNSLRLVLTMSLWSVGRLGRENKVSDTKPVHSLGEFLRHVLAKKGILYLM